MNDEDPDFSIYSKCFFRPLNTESQVQSQATLCGFYGGKMALGQVLFIVLPFSLSVSFHKCLTLVHLTTTDF
jgi:hypothetical protein